MRSDFKLSVRDAAARAARHSLEWVRSGARDLSLREEVLQVPARGSPRAAGLTIAIATLGGGAVLGLVAPLHAHAGTAQQESAFARDRNTTVGERGHPEYMPLNIRLGTFVLRPELDIGLDYTDDVFASNTQRNGDAYLHLAPIVNIESDWLRNDLTAYVKTSYDQYYKYTSENAAQADLGTTFKYDTIKNSYVSVFGEYTNQIESRNSTNYNLNLQKPLRFQSFTATVESVTELNRLRYSTSGTAQEFVYYPDKLKTGGLQNNKTNNGVFFRGHGEVEYAMNPGAAVYYYIGANELQFPTASGQQSRNSSGFDTAVGTNFDITSVVRGDVRIGYLQQYYVANINPVGGLSLEASVDYFPTPLTTVIFSAQRTIQSTNVPTAASEVVETGSAKVEHELFRNIILTAGASLEQDSYNGSCTTPGCVYGRRDNQWSASVGATYLVNRRVGLKFDYSREVLNSTGPNRAPSYSTDLVQITTMLHY